MAKPWSQQTEAERRKRLKSYKKSHWSKDVNKREQVISKIRSGIQKAIEDNRFSPKLYTETLIKTSRFGIIPCDSSWEVKRVLFLDSCLNVVGLEKEPFKIRYRLDGITRLYLPDFLITYQDGCQVLEEIKSRHMTLNQMFKAKLKAATVFCREKGLTFRVISSQDKLTTQ